MTARLGAVVVVAAMMAAAPAARRGPVRLSDADFWTLVANTSEPGGAFHSDNFTSNELNVGDVVAELADTMPHGGAYLGVGPEQNFTYIAAVRPDVAFIVDIRRQAVLQHLLFKAIFDLAPDRAEFVALLFSQPRAPGVTAASPIGTIWDAMSTAPGSDADRREKNLAAIEADLIRAHGFPLTDADRASLEYVYQAFYQIGPTIDYGGYASRLSTGGANFIRLSELEDRHGAARSFLGSDAAYQFVRDLERRNLVVPVVGDFAGPHALRAIGAYLRDHDEVVRAFYVSNVEQYLFNPRMPAAPGGIEVNGGWQAFYANVETLPLDASSVFIRPPFGSSTLLIRRPQPDGTIEMVHKTARPICPIGEFLTAVHAGQIAVQLDANACGG